MEKVAMVQTEQNRTKKKEIDSKKKK